MTKWFKALAVFTAGLLILLFGLFSVVCLLFGVSPLDPLLRTTHILAKAESKDDHQFAVMQYWNGVDFYTTELWHKEADSHDQIRMVIVDADDKKI